MALRDGIIAPTIGYESFDQECELDVVPNYARNSHVEGVISNAFAFGGMNAVLVLKSVSIQSLSRECCMTISETF